MKRAAYCHFHTDFLLVKLHTFSHQTAQFCCPWFNAHPAPRCGWEGGTSLPFPLWHRIFQMLLKLPKLATANLHSHPLYFSSNWYFDRFFKTYISHNSLLACQGSHSTADPHGASAPPVAPKCLLQGPGSAQLCSEVGSEQDLLCQDLCFGQDGWWQWNCCT